jgi:hypothetical protein
MDSSILLRLSDEEPRIIETAWVILNRAGAWLGYSVLSMIAGVSTALKPDQ